MTFLGLLPLMRPLKAANAPMLVLPVAFLERLAALPPGDHAPRGHLGLALDEHISSDPHQRLAPQLVVREIWSNG